MTWCKRIVIFFCIFIIFSFNFISPFTYSVLGRTKTDMILKNFWKIIVPLPIKRWKQYLPTLFFKFFSHKWNIPSLIASFREHLDGTFAEKFIFPTNHTWESRECQIIFQKSKKEASTTIAANASSNYFLTYERDFNMPFITFLNFNPSFSPRR